MPEYVYHMHELTKAYPGGRKVLENINLSFYPDAKIGVLGINGSGKSTLMRIMAGIDKEFVGEAWAAKDARVGYLPQEPELDATKNVRENVMVGVASSRAILERYNELAANYSDETADEMAKLQDEIEAKGLWDLDSKIDLAMDALRCPPDDAKVETLSGGEKRRVALCKLLLEAPELLLLDEPTNHLDAETVAWLEGHLKQYPGAVLIVTHDRYFLDHVTSWILELDRGRGIPYAGNYSAWLEQKQKRLEQEGREEAAHQRAIVREREWINASPRARQSKGKARIKAYDELLAKAADRLPGSAQIIIPAGPRLGRHGDRRRRARESLWRHAAVRRAFVQAAARRHRRRHRPERCGQDHAVPPHHRPGEGRRRQDQRRRDRRARLRGPEPRLARRQEERLGGNFRRPGRDPSRQARDAEPRLCGRVQFQGRRPAEEGRVRCQGGERNRVHLAKMLKSGVNVLLLDEPTNDLDVETLRALEEGLEDFAGCAVIISHDRFFLDRIATHILAFEGDSHVEWFEGNFEAYEADKKRRLGVAAEIPQLDRVQEVYPSEIVMAELVPAIHVL